MSLFFTSRLAAALGVGVIPVVVLEVMDVSSWGFIAAWLSACAAGVTLDVSLAANPKQVEVVRRAPTRALRGEPLEVSLVLQNTGARRLRGSVRDAWPASARARFDRGPSSAKPAQVSGWGPLEMASGELLRIPYSLTPKRAAQLHSPSVVVRALGPLGLAGREARYALPGSVRVIRGSWRKKGAPAITPAPAPGEVLAAALQGADGGSITDAIAELRDLAAVYGSRAHLAAEEVPHPVVGALYEHFPRMRPEEPQPDFSAGILPLTDHVTDLFVRASQSGSEQQLRLLIQEYRGTLAKLTMALADDYYGDILRNPHYWSNPNDRISEVYRAVAAVDLQVVENIRQLNESRDLEFKVALDSLTSILNDAKLSDVYSDRAGNTATGNAENTADDPAENATGNRQR
ncbi:MAG: hypothetical protein ACK5LO_02050 [Leucobacter sp.]